tara:strand:- start:902 stop:1168 length:267 start_codon:yes stop_codon:yes gene_type:complete
MNLDLQIGDLILTGRFKNKKVIVKEFGKDAKGQPTINGRPMLNFRIKKLMPLSDKEKEAQKKVKAVNIFDQKINEYISKVIDKEINKS